MVVVAIGGAPLVGDRILRILYVDESGHSAKEPVALVAGLILNPDRQWRVLAERLDALRELVPEEFRDGFVFHANILFNGGKYRERWNREDSRSLLKKILAIPREMKIPIVLGYIRKSKERSDPGKDSLSGVCAMSHCC